MLSFEMLCVVVNAIFSYDAHRHCCLCGDEPLEPSSGTWIGCAASSLWPLQGRLLQDLHQWQCRSGLSCRVLSWSLKLSLIENGATETDGERPCDLYDPFCRS